MKWKFKGLQRISAWLFLCPHQHLDICPGKTCSKLHHHLIFHLSPVKWGPSCTSENQGFQFRNDNMTWKCKRRDPTKKTWSTMMILLSINLSSKYHQISLTRQFSACMGSSTLHSPPWITWFPVSVFPTHRHPRKNTPPKRNKQSLTHTQNRTHIQIPSSFSLFIVLGSSVIL